MAELVEVLFSIIERQALRRGTFARIQELVVAIGRFCAGWNQRCQPFAWTRDADQLLAKVNGGITTATSDHYDPGGRARCSPWPTW